MFVFDALGTQSKGPFYFIILERRQIFLHLVPAQLKLSHKLYQDGKIETIISKNSFHLQLHLVSYLCRNN